MPSKAAALSLTIDEGLDPIDGSENNAVRRKVLELLAKTDDDLTDAEYFGKAPDHFHFTTFALETLHRLPSEIEHMGCREWTHIQAHGIVRRAMHELQQAWRDADHD